MGPLEGLKVVEIAGIGPGPFCAMILADLGAEVLRVDRAGSVVPRACFVPPPDHRLNRGRRSVGVDLKSEAGAKAVLRMVERADALIEGFRPGVAERLGIGPEQCHERNPKLVYGRMTGWGQQGPYANSPGHDINYIALTGVLAAVGPGGGAPVAPLNLVGDYGGGGMLLAVGLLAAIFEAGRSGRGQTVDAAMLDGAALLASLFYAMRDSGNWAGGRGGNLLDGGAPFYGVYETADARYVSIGSIEEKFYANLLAALEIDPAAMPAQMDRSSWPQTRALFAEIFKARTQAQWCERLEHAEVCFAPVLDFDEARVFEQNRARGTFVEYDEAVQPAPSPRFDRTPAAIRSPPPIPGEHTEQALADWGFDAAEIQQLRASATIR